MATPARTTEVFETLKLDRGAWLINQITTRRWGNELIFHAIYDVNQPHTTFKITFKDCHKIEWQSYGFEDEVDEHDIHQADVIGMDIGEGRHLKPASITTDLFEILITYGELIVEKDW